MTLLAPNLVLATATDLVRGQTAAVTPNPGERRRSMTVTSDLELLDHQMARLADGDRSMVGPLFRALWAPVHAYCERALGAGPDADDAAQQVMETIFQDASRYDRTRKALPWTLAVALWECRTVRRRRQRSRVVGVDNVPEVAAPGTTPEDAVIQAQLIEEARALLGTLSPLDRKALDDTFSEEVEDRSPVAGATLRKRRERALRRLREAWRLLYGR